MYNALLNNKIAQNNTLYKYSMLSCKFMNKRIYNLYGKRGIACQIAESLYQAGLFVERSYIQSFIKGEYVCSFKI